MKTPSLFSMSILSSVTLVVIMSGCGEKAAPMKSPPAGMHALDLGRFGKPFAIFVPDTVKNKLEFTEQGTGALEIRCGRNFGIAISEQAADLSLLKKDLQDDEVNRLKNILKDDSASILWESEVVQPEYHFFVNRNINGSDYSFEDIKNTEMEPFSKSDVEQMFESAINVQPSMPRDHH